jgi:hypothetical protein
VNIVRWACSLDRETANQVNRRVLRLYDQRVRAAMVARKIVDVNTTEPPSVVEELSENAVDEEVPAAPVAAVEASNEEAVVAVTNTVTSSKGNADSELDRSVAPLRLAKATTASIPAQEPTSSTYAAMGQPGFLDMAAELLSSAMLELLRDVVWEEDQAGRLVVEEVLVDSD